MLKSVDSGKTFMGLDLGFSSSCVFNFLMAEFPRTVIKVGSMKTHKASKTESGTEFATLNVSYYCYLKNNCELSEFKVILRSTNAQHNVRVLKHRAIIPCTLILPVIIIQSTHGGNWDRTKWHQQSGLDYKHG